MPRWKLDITDKACPACGAGPVLAGEITLNDRCGYKRFGPFVEFACGLIVFLPGNCEHGQKPEVLNLCGTVRMGKGVVDIEPDDYEVREGRERVPDLLDGSTWATIARYNLRHSTTATDTTG